MEKFGRPVQILLVEDNPADIRLTQESLKEADLPNILHSVTKGQDALDFLYRRNDFEDAPTADLVLLDLNLPGMSGHDVLSTIKQDPALMTIPVVVLTSSESEMDVVKAYREHANCFVAKPVDFESFLEVVKSIEQFWFSTVRLPTA